MTLAPHVIVKHHPAREHMLPWLLEALAPLPTRVVVDPRVTDPDGPLASLHVRARLLAAVFGHLRALIPEGTSHVLVLEDDSEPCARIADVLAAVLDQKPEALLALWTPSSLVASPDLESGSTFAPLRPLVAPHVALCFPVDLAFRFGGFLARWPLGIIEDPVPAFVRESKTEFLAPLPSLFEHRDDEPSLAHAGRYGDGERVAHLFDETGAAWLEWITGGATLVET